jgi:hypothetical protein
MFIAIQIVHQNKLKDSKESTKFLGLDTYKHINRMEHIEEILPKLSSACYITRSMYYTSSISTLGNDLLCLLQFKIRVWHHFWGKFK